MTQTDSLDSVNELNTQGVLARRQIRYADAEKYHLQALLTLQRETARTLNELGTLAQIQQEFQRAHEYYQQAYTLCSQNLGPTHVETLEHLGDLAGSHEELGDVTQAEILYEEALTLSQQALNRDDPHLALALSKSARFDRVQKRYDRALERFLAALAIYEKHPETRDFATALNNLGFLYEERGLYEEAEQVLNRAVEIAERISRETRLPVAAPLKNLANVYAKQGKDEQADALYQQALAIYHQTVGAADADTIKTQKSYDTFLLRK